MLSPFECLCGNFILPEPASYVFFYAVFNLRNLLYLIVTYMRNCGIEDGFVQERTSAEEAYTPAFDGTGV